MRDKSEVIKLNVIELKMLDELRERYSSENGGIKLSDAGGYRLIVKSPYVDDVSNLTPHADMSRGLLRVLSIIAYHEPVQQADIVKVVGNRTYEYVKDLEMRGLIKWERKGRTKMLSTTPHFEDYFGAKKAQIKKELKKLEEKGKEDLPLSIDPDQAEDQQIDVQEQGGVQLTDDADSTSIEELSISEDGSLEKNKDD